MKEYDNLIYLFRFLMIFGILNLINILVMDAVAGMEPI